jgi:ribosome-associated protein
MDNLSKNKAFAVKTAELLWEHKCEDVILLDISRVSSFSDFLVVATVRSAGHQRGLLNILHGFLKENEIEPFQGRKRAETQGWILIDCGFLVINLMDKESRDFYELEKVWFEGEKIPLSVKE